jgi:hypothetical protein
MPRYYFDVRDGHRFVDPSGLVFKNDHDAIVVSIDQPEVDPTRHISVQNDARVEIFKVPVYSKPVAWFVPREIAQACCLATHELRATDKPECRR